MPDLKLELIISLQGFGFALCFLLSNKNKLVVLKMKCQNPFGLRIYYVYLWKLTLTILNLYFKFCSVDHLEFSVIT